MSSKATNLPEPSFSGPLTMRVDVDISAPIERVWEVLTDFPKYKEWYVLTGLVYIGCFE